MKLTRHLAAAVGLALACSLLRLDAQTPDLTIDTFDTGTQGAQPNGCNIWYGSGLAGWEGAVDNTGNSGGSLHINCNINTSSDTPLTEYVCALNENPWYSPTTWDFSLYKAIQFDIKWDTNSTLSIDQFNNPTNWPTNFLQAGFASNILSGSTTGLEIDVCGGGGKGAFTYVTDVNIPDAASNGWQHISIPINPTMSGLAGNCGIMLKKYINNHQDVSGASITGNFWVDNVVLQGTAAPPPPPTLRPPVKAISGVNIFAGTSGLYDREEVVAVANSGLSWVNQATAANPVTYSFTIKGFPANVPAYSAEAYLMLVPNPAGHESAPDWNETNVLVAAVKSTANGGGAMALQYKVNESYGQDMYYGANAYTNASGSWNGTTPNYLETGNLTNVNSSNILGAWTIQFTSNTGGMLIAPDGTAASFNLPSYNASLFAETTGFNIYLGMQANDSSALNQAVVYSSFSVSNTPSAFNDNFQADPALNTNVWNKSYATDTSGVLVVPPGNPYWIAWTLPANGYTLTDSSSLAPNATWNNVSTYGALSLNGVNQQLISTNDLTTNSAEFFRLVKRSFTQLLVLLPGETNAPNTATGKVGTPTPVSASLSEGQEIFTVMAVDAQWNPIQGSSDTIAISSTDSAAALPNNNSLNNGTQQFTIYLDPGAPTITATDISNTNILSNTSTPVTVTQ